VDPEWRQIEGYPNYIISDQGEVVSLTYDRPLKQRPNGAGYLRVALSNDGVIKDFYVHQLVAQAFFGGWEPGVRVKHRNGDKENNATSNLRMMKGYAEDPKKRVGEREPWGKRIKIVETGEVFRSARDCARYIDGDYSSIYACLRGERKQHRGFTFEYLEDW